jgi:hypothetical protein
MLRWIKNLFKKQCDHRFDQTVVNDLNNDDPNCKLCGISFHVITSGHVYRYVPVNDKEFGLLKVK